ncbi:hypothetical protein F5Y15DRAFT_303641 [Xylariaceae sp. FL0016]|nr:hypothetical protein F5Y15DRAFT_303641 [Xylariaceae sp. FL0016]
MPVTVRPADTKLTSVKAEHFQSTKRLLTEAASDKICRRMKGDEIYQTSFSDDEVKSRGLQGTRNSGFVRACLDAYNRHHHLVIRPDDVWITILTQFSFYINAHAEEMRSAFVSHKGKKELALGYGANMEDFDFSIFAMDMSDLLSQSVVDPTLRDWIIPRFSTTERNDEVVASIIMMGTMKAYFSYVCMLMCGLPYVTLQGTREDWQLICDKLDKLAEYGDEPSRFATVLRPVLSRFVGSFDEPGSESTKDFWQHICHVEPGGSGPDRLNGWLNAFCFWNHEGRVQFSESLRGFYPREMKKTAYEIDGVKYGSLDMDDIPPAFAHADVKVLDNTGREFNTVMLAGMMALKSSDHVDENDTSTAKVAHSVIRPVAGWYIFDVCSEEEAEELGKEEEFGEGQFRFR